MRLMVPPGPYVGRGAPLTRRAGQNHAVMDAAGTAAASGTAIITSILARLSTVLPVGSSLGSAARPARSPALPGPAGQQDTGVECAGQRLVESADVEPGRAQAEALDDGRLNTVASRNAAKPSPACAASAQPSPWARRSPPGQHGQRYAGAMVGPASDIATRRPSHD